MPDYYFLRNIEKKYLRYVLLIFFCNLSNKRSFLFSEISKKSFLNIIKCSKCRYFVFNFKSVFC